MSAFEDLRDVSAASLAKLNDMLRYLYKKVQGGITKAELAPELADDIDTVDGEKLEAGAVTADKIEDEAIASYHIQEAAIGTAHIQEAAITTALIEDASITNAKIDRASVDRLVVVTADIHEGAITSAQIGELAVDTAQIKDGAISTVKIGEEQVTTSKIGNAQITSAKIGTLQVTGAHIDNATIDSSKIISIDTNVVNIASADGKMSIIGPTQVVKDASNNVRVALGDILGDGTKYGLAVYGADGATALFNEDGITPNGIPPQAVDTDKLADYAVSYAKLSQTTADATITVGTGKDFSTPQEAIDSLPSIINHNITLDCYTGTYGDIVAMNFTGGGLLRIAQHTGETMTFNSLIITDIWCGIFINNLTIVGYSSTNAGIDINATNFFALNSLTMTVSNPTKTGVRMTHAVGQIYNCTISNRSFGISAQYGSILILNTVSGVGNTTGFEASASTVHDMGLTTITGTTPRSTPAGGIIIPSTGLQVSGADAKMITGTPGTSGNLAAWNADGDIVGATQMSFTQSGVSYSNSWADYGGSFAFGYMKDSLGFVHLRGLLTGGTTTSGTVMANLPANYRPASQTQYFPVACNGSSYAPGVVSINGTTGNITLYSGSGWVSLNGITFYAG